MKVLNTCLPSLGPVPQVCLTPKSSSTQKCSFVTSDCHVISTICKHFNIYEVMVWGSKRMIISSTAFHNRSSTSCLTPLICGLYKCVSPPTQLPLHSPVHRAPTTTTTTTMPPIWLEQRMQAGQPSRSLSKAAEYSSSLGVSPPPLRPGLGPFNKEQVHHMEGGGGGGVRLQGVGGMWRPFLSFFYFCLFVPRLCRQSALVNIFLVFVVLTQ